MGVHGLTPFLKKNFPSVLKTLPGRFRDIQGKTVAIDGTLITQRFHFAQLPHKYKHVLGWYRLLTELKNNNINAICIFDGDDRSIAKLQEVERRRLARRVVTDRGNLETERLHRLTNVKTILESLHSLKPIQPLAQEDHTVTETTVQDQFDSLTLGESEEKKEPSETVEPETLEVVENDSSEDTQESITIYKTPDKPTPKSAKSAEQDETEYDNVGPTSESEGRTLPFNDPDPIPTASSVPPSTAITPIISSAEDVSAKQTDFIKTPRVADEEVISVLPSDSLHEPSQLESAKAADCDIISPARGTVLDEGSHEEESAEESDEEADSRMILVDEAISQSKPLEPGQTGKDRKTTSFDDGSEAEILTYTEETPPPTTTQDTYEELCKKLIEWHTDFLQYKQFTQQGTVPQTLEDTSSTETAVLLPSHASDDGVQESKLQISLTKEEESVWTDLNTWRTSGTLNYSLIDLSSLIEKSQILRDSYQRRSNTPTSSTYEECRMIIRAMGMPCIICDGPYEAEALASSLVRHGKADFVASEDTDVLVYGAKLLRNVTSTDKDLVSLSGTEIQDALALHGPSFLDFALLLGTDFSPRLHSLGPARALRFITAHGSIENVIEKEVKYTPVDVEAYLAQVRLAREVFTTLPPVPQDEQLKTSETDRESVTELLGRFKLMRAAFEHDWDPQISLAGNYFQETSILGGEFYDYAENKFK